MRSAMEVMRRMTCDRSSPNHSLKRTVRCSGRPCPEQVDVAGTTTRKGTASVCYQILVLLKVFKQQDQPEKFLFRSTLVGLRTKNAKYSLPANSWHFSGLFRNKFSGSQSIL